MQITFFFFFVDDHILQAMDVGSVAIDEPSVKTEQETMNKPTDPMQL